MNTVLFKRFLRTAIPQLPAVLAYFAGVKPELTAILSLVGALLTTFDKWARDTSWYDKTLNL